MNRLGWMVLVAGAVLAQGAEAGEFRVGAWGGPNVASLEIEGAPKEERESRTAVAVGGLFAWRSPSGWSVQLRPSFAGRGAKVEVEGAQAEIRANSLELPLLITRELGTGKARPYLLAGVALARRSSATAVIGSTEIDIDDDFERSDASLRFGAGVRGNQQKAQPFAEVEYTLGFTDLNKATAGFGSEVGAIKHRGVQVRVGISFGVGGK